MLGRGGHSLGNTVHVAVCCLVHPERKKSYYKPNIIHNCNKSILSTTKKDKIIQNPLYLVNHVLGFRKDKVLSHYLTNSRIHENIKVTK